MGAHQFSMFTFLAQQFNFASLFAAFAPKMQSLGCGWDDQFSAASVDTNPLGKQCEALCKIVTKTTVPFGPYKGNPLRDLDGWYPIQGRVCAYTKCALYSIAPEPGLLIQEVET